MSFLILLVCVVVVRAAPVIYPHRALDLDSPLFEWLAWLIEVPYTTIRQIDWGLIAHRALLFPSELMDLFCYLIEKYPPPNRQRCSPYLPFEAACSCRLF